MEERKLKRKPPLSFINRGGKHVQGVAVGDEDPDHSPMDDRPSEATSGRRTKPIDSLLEKKTHTRSSRI